MTRFAPATRTLARRALVAGLAFAPLLALAPAPAEAQNTGCRGRVFIDSVYQVGLGGNRYEYFVQVRNGTPGTLTMTVNIGGFSSNFSNTSGATVTVFSPQLSVTLGSNSGQTIRFANGTDGNINAGTVSVNYDMPADTSRPSVTVTGCRAA